MLARCTYFHLAFKEGFLDSTKVGGEVRRWLARKVKHVAPGSHGEGRRFDLHAKR